MATVEVRRMMAGDPQKVYELIAGVTRMGEWSPESAGGEWLTGEPGTVGSAFRGDNRRPWMKWSTICTVITAEPGKRFAFAVKAAGLPVSTWEYEISARAGGCQVTERTFDQRPLRYRLMSFSRYASLIDNGGGTTRTIAIPFPGGPRQRHGIVRLTAQP